MKDVDQTRREQLRKDVEAEVAFGEYQETLAQAAAKRESDARLAAAERATGTRIGDRVTLADICAEQRYLIGRAGTVRAYARGGSGWELDVELDEPWTDRDAAVCLPAFCWRKG